MKCLHCGKRIRNKRQDALYCSSRCRVAYNRNRHVTFTDPSACCILSLCDYWGTWSAPYRDAGYRVEQIDIQTGQDVRLLPYPGPVHGILAAPPCTMFARAGNRWTRSEDQMREALSVVDACLRFVAMCAPAWWCLENPTGKLSRYLGDPVWRFDPCDYGDPYTKRTCLWGEFTVPRPSSQPVEPLQTSPGHHRIDAYLKAQGYTLGRKRAMLRSMTPPGFAQAFFRANK